MVQYVRVAGLGSVGQCIKVKQQYVASGLEGTLLTVR